MAASPNPPATMKRRSFLFVPANRPERYEKALATRAHGVIVDLEDAVAPDEKPQGREALANWLSDAHPVLVRINATGTEWFADDVRICAHPGVAGIVLPKAEQPDDVARVATACPGIPIYPLIESARGLWDVLDVARSTGVASVLFGSIDYQADVGTSDEDLLYARSRIVLASRVAGIEAPIDGVTQAIDDPELLRRECVRSRQLGFGAKLCIHPKQVDIVNGCFAPTQDEIAWAEGIVDAVEKSRGAAVKVDGRMVDRPVLLKAQAILAERAGRRQGS